MPIYEYKCPRCGHMEEILLLNRMDIAVCPVDNVVMTKMVSVPSFKFKGGGWTGKKINDLDPDKQTKTYIDGSKLNAQD